MLNFEDAGEKSGGGARGRMEPTRFSRCLSGRLDFAPHERKHISGLLGIDESWLFSQPVPRPLTTNGTPEVSRVGPSAMR